MMLQFRSIKHRGSPVHRFWAIGQLCSRQLNIFSAAQSKSKACRKGRRLKSTCRCWRQSHACRNTYQLPTHTHTHTLGITKHMSSRAACCLPGKTTYGIYLNLTRLGKRFPSFWQSSFWVMLTFLSARVWLVCAVHRWVCTTFRTPSHLVKPESSRGNGAHTNSGLPGGRSL